MWRESVVAKSLDEEEGDVDYGPVDEGEFIVVVDFARSVPVY